VARTGVRGPWTMSKLKTGPQWSRQGPLTPSPGPSRSPRGRGAAANRRKKSLGNPLDVLV